MNQPKNPNPAPPKGDPGTGNVLPFQKPTGATVPAGSHGACKAEACKSKGVRADFCEQHYEWFKEGLITLDGFHAKDYEKKYLNYLKRQDKAA